MAEPAVTLRAVHDSGTGNLPPTRYVVHATAGGRGYPKESAAGVARNTALYFQMAKAGGSAHYIHDAGGNEEHCVPENVVAWHAPPNDHSIGDEICADPSYTREQWLATDVWPAVRASAIRCREVCERRGIPKVKLSADDLKAGKHGICGHVDVSNAFKQSTHWDPGPNFPWDRYMAVVNGQEAEDDMATVPQDQWDHLMQMVGGLTYAIAPEDGVNSQGEVLKRLRGIQAATDPKYVATQLAAALPALGAAQPVSQADLEAALRKVLASIPSS